MRNIDDDELVTVTGGAIPPASQTSQQELRAMAKQYCPQTHAQFQGRAAITRPMAQQCLNEAGYGNYGFMLDRYFPRKG